MKKLRLSRFDKIAFVIITLLVVVIGFNSYQINAMKKSSVNGKYIAGFSLPSGVPEIYGSELGISFDDVSASNPQKADETIRLLGNIDRETELTGTDLERYINILYRLENGISCEYCCGARAVIFETGDAACGCAHSYAMRGLTKYLILNHGDEMSDEQILEEIGKWKSLFFPSQIANKAVILSSKGVELNFINLASNKYRGIERSVASGSSGGMVGGC